MDNVNKTIVEALREMCEQTEGGDEHRIVRFCNDYSGRGMRGRPCVGITGSEAACLKVIGEVITSISNDIVADAGDAESDEEMHSVSNRQSEFGQVVHTLLNFERDSMGYDVILYWSDVEPIEEEGVVESES